MADPVRIEVRGDKELVRDFRDLDAKVGKQFTRTALRAGAKIIQDRAIANAPRGKKGLLKGDIKVRSARGGKGVVSVMVVAGKGKAFYAGFVEAGHYMGTRIRGVKTTAEYHKRSLARGRKWVEGKHFLEMAAEQVGEAAANKAVETLTNLIGQETGS